MPPSRKYSDPDVIAQISDLTLRSRRLVEGAISGLHRSPFHGFNIEFAEYREYTPGDDLRRLDWRVFARTDRHYIKQYEEESNVRVTFVVDASASMTTHGGLKMDYTRKLAAALCYVGLVRLDSIEIHGFSDRLARRLLSTGGRHRISAVMDGLAAIPAGGRTDYLAVVREFITNYSQRGLVIILSDFLDDSGCERALGYLADFGHELMLLQIWADEDRRPPWLGELDLRDAETGSAMKLDIDEIARERYTAAFDEYSKELERLALRSGGRCAGIATSQPLEAVIFGELIRMQGIA